MLLFLISFFSFLLFFKSFSSNSPLILPMESEWRLILSPWFWEDLSNFLASWFKKTTSSTSVALNVPLKMPLNIGSENMEENKVCLLDLPELALECIFERLSPSGLCNMVGVCRCLRERCTSDHLWEKHLNQKWGRLIGDTATREWKCFVASRNKTTLLGHTNQNGFLQSFTTFWPFAWIRPKFETRNNPTTSLPLDSFMALYMSLETGKFWFPAQVYNRENGHVGFMLSCYDAQLRYDSRTDSFQARYSPYGRRMIEENIQWDRIRAPPVDTLADVLHVSDCLNDLKPGDHVEVQWRKSKEFPYGWWYAVIGHVESCDGNERRCRCKFSETVVLEFNQYSRGSRWRQTMINRKDHREEGNEADGFYGGIRKLHEEQEIGMWKRLWPNQVFE